MESRYVSEIKRIEMLYILDEGGLKVPLTEMENTTENEYLRCMYGDISVLDVLNLKCK